MNLKHFVITRFLNQKNMRFRKFLLDEIVIEYRMKLMTKYLYPPLNNQSNLNFTHIILIHEKLPKKYIDQINKIDCNFKKIIMTSEQLKDFIKNEYTKCDFLITSRIDDDDMIYYNAIDDIQKSINDNTIINVYGYKKGCTMIDGETKKFKYKTNINHGMIAILLTLIINTKKVTNPITIYDLGNHTKIKDQLIKNHKMLGIDNLPDDFWKPNVTVDPAWIYIRHEKSDSGTKHRSDKIVKFGKFKTNKFFGLE